MSKPTRPLSYYDILDACKEPGCPFCRLGQDAVERHLDSVIYDSVNSISLRATLRKARGYCHEHAWQLPLAGGSAPLGIAIIYRDILNTLNKELDSASYKSGRLSLKTVKQAVRREEPAAATADTIRSLDPQAACPACERQQEIENLAFLALTDALAEGDPAMITAVNQATIICMPHFKQALAYTRNKTGYTELVTAVQAKITALITDLDEFLRKNDHRFRNETITPAEKDSWQRALLMLVGINDYPQGE